jgi:hypothetical protein
LTINSDLLGREEEGTAGPETLPRFEHRKYGRCRLTGTWLAAMIHLARSGAATIRFRFVYLRKLHVRQVFERRRSIEWGLLRHRWLRLARVFGSGSGFGPRDSLCLGPGNRLFLRLLRVKANGWKEHRSQNNAGYASGMPSPRPRDLKGSWAPHFIYQGGHRQAFGNQGGACLNHGAKQTAPGLVDPCDRRQVDFGMLAGPFCLKRLLRLGNPLTSEFASKLQPPKLAIVVNRNPQHLSRSA